jgi:hypothetical protein
MAESAMREPPMSRVKTFMAHSIPGLMVIAIAARVLALCNVPYFSGLDALSSWLVIIAVLMLTFHIRGAQLCLRCIKSAPLNPQRDVERNKAFLWQFHWSRKQFYKVWFACLAPVVLSHFTTGILSTLLKLPMDIMFFTLMWGFYVHHRLQPWCPWCRRWDEGGDEELVPDPDPAEGAKRR